MRFSIKWRVYLKFSEFVGDRHTSYFCRGTREEGQTVVVFNQADFILCRQLVTKQSPESQATPVLATNHELLEREIRFILHLLLGFKLVISFCTFMLVANSIETVHLCMALFPTGENSTLPASVCSDFSENIYRREENIYFESHL